MKKIIFILGVLTFVSCSQSNKETEESNTPKKESNYIAVYDFHNDHRCKSCLTIERLAKETLEENFKNEMDDSTIIFSLINVDAPENEEMAEEYEAFGTDLMIVVFKDGEEDILDLTDWAFEAIHTDEFKSEFKKEIDIALKKL